MKLTELQHNTIDRLFDVLENLEDPAKQLRYKKTVPFVHVPIELFNQWETFPRLVQEQRDWFVSICSAEQLASITDFDRHVQAFVQLKNDDIPDVPEVLGDEDWKTLGQSAGQLRKQLILDQPEVWGDSYMRLYGLD